ncbi:MAG: ABC transporter ATP-binding protein [Deinococcota bacterium]|nr:ABC transporter ATP-binding protein [Deinococcota bacterium]
MTELELVSLEKRFGDVLAVKGINLKVDAGSLVALLGPSGCGKTTTLRMIAGLETVSGGDILFDGDSVQGIPSEKRNIGMVFQRYVLFPHMTVARNVGFGLQMRGVNKPEIDRRVAEVLEVVQLGGFEKRFPSQLSGGQQQRVAIARTVVTDPRLMLMDEPLSNLDAKLREEMRAFITRLQRQLGVTTLFVTHDQVEAIELADRIGVMFDGKIEQFGTPEEIFNRPKSTRIADFMGTTNLLKGKLQTKRAQESALQTTVCTLRVGHAVRQTEGTLVTATVRPEHIELDRPYAPSPSENSFVARISDAVYYGGTINYKVEADCVQLQVKDLSARRFSVGEEVTVRLPKEHIWIFPE